jgi:hypothetical protein
MIFIDKNISIVFKRKIKKKNRKRRIEKEE